MRCDTIVEKNQIEHIISQLKECFDGKPWYGISVKEKLDAIPWEIVNECRYGSKSIAVLVQHVINWRVFVLKKLKGDVAYDLKIDGPNDWNGVHISNKQQWDELKAHLKQTQIELLEILADGTDGLLDEELPGKKYTFVHVLTGIIQHDIYHLGQIAMLNSMQRS